MAYEHNCNWRSRGHLNIRPSLDAPGAPSFFARIPLTASPTHHQLRNILRVAPGEVHTITPLALPRLSDQYGRSPTTTTTVALPSFCFPLIPRLWYIRIYTWLHAVSLYRRHHRRCHYTVNPWPLQTALVHRHHTLQWSTAHCVAASSTSPFR